MNNIYIIGNGYIGDHIVNDYGQDYRFIGVCRSKKNNCKENISLDISKNGEALRELINRNSVIIYLAAPQSHGITDETLKNFLLNINKSNVIKIIYISTSGVYGDKNDEIVNESSVLNPLTDRAKRRVNAEGQIQKSGVKYTVLRVPGIYGPNRLPLKRIEERLPLIQVSMCKHTNLIHAKDLSRIIVNCISNERTDNIIMNVSDGTPIKTTDYYLHIYDALKIKYPEFINYKEANEKYDEKRKSFINESRILDVSRMNAVFPNVIRFKDVVEGINDCLK